MQLTSLMIVFLDLFLPDKPSLWQASTSCGPTVTSKSESIDETFSLNLYLPQYQECR